MSLLTRYKTPSAPAQVLAEGLDLSPEGVFISSERPEALGTLLEIEWEARGSGRTLRALGRVAWVRPEAHEGKPPGMGVEFVKTGPDGRRAVSSIPPPGPDGEEASAEGADTPGAADTPEDAGEAQAPAAGPEASGGATVTSLDERRAKLTALRDRVSRAKRVGRARGGDAVETDDEPTREIATGDDARAIGVETRAAAAEVVASVASVASEAATVGEALGRPDDDWDSAPTTLMTAASHLAATAATSELESTAPRDAPAESSQAAASTDAPAETAAAPADGDVQTVTDVHAEAAGSTTGTSDASADATPSDTASTWEETTDTDARGEAAASAAGDAEPATQSDLDTRSGARSDAAPGATAAEELDRPSSESVIELEEEDEVTEEREEPAEDAAAQPARPDSARPFLLKGDVPTAQFRWKPWLVGGSYIFCLGLVVWVIWIRLPWKFLDWLETPSRPARIAATAAPATPPPAATAPAPPAPATAPAAPRTPIAPGVEAVPAAAAYEYALSVATVPPRAQASVGSVTIVTPGVLSLGTLDAPVTLRISQGGYEIEEFVIDRQGFALADGLMKRSVSIELLPQGAARAPAALAAPEPASGPAAPSAPPQPSATPAPASAPAKAAPGTTATRAPAKPKTKTRKPAAEAPAPAPTPEAAPEAPQLSPLKAAQACLMRGDNDCAVDALEGKARTPRELELLIETYRATGNPSKQWATMKTYVERFPDEKRAATYRQTLGE